MHVDVEVRGGEEVNAEDGCCNVSNMENPVVDSSEPKVQFHGSFAVCDNFRVVSSPEALAFAFVRPVNLFRG